MEQFLNFVRTAFAGKAPGLLGCSEATFRNVIGSLPNAVHLPELLRLHATIDTQTIHMPR
jgi:hypothetical protein